MIVQFLNLKSSPSLANIPTLYPIRYQSKIGYSNKPIISSQNVLLSINKSTNHLVKISASAPKSGLNISSAVAQKTYALQYSYTADKFPCACIG
jgi:hypothetical protein